MSQFVFPFHRRDFLLGSLSAAGLATANIPVAFAQARNVIPLNQPIHDVAMQKNISGYEFWFHREPDYRQFMKA